jgi:hypothetical protein
MESVLLDLALTLLASGVPAVLVAWLLSVVPGPWQGLVGAIAHHGIEFARKSLEEYKDDVAEDAVRAAEQIVNHREPEPEIATLGIEVQKARENQEKLGYALEVVEERLHVDAKEARDRVEAAVHRVKERAALAIEEPVK